MRRLACLPCLLALLPCLLALLPTACAPAVTHKSAPKEPLPFAPAGPDAAPDPSTFGPYPVGVRTLTFVDPTRQTPGFEGPRTLVTEIWYPAVEAARDQSKQDYVLYEQLPEHLRGGLTPEDLGTLETEAVRDAPARQDGDRFPVVVFSHGKGGIRGQSTYFTVALASHGYVVVSPDHEGDTLIELLEAREVDVVSTYDSYLLRPGDVSFLLDALEDLDEDDPLTGLMDTERVGVSGHSFGALTSFRAAGLDSRIDAVVAHTPVGIGLVQIELDVPVEDFGIPLMIAAAGMDRTLPKEIHADSLWEHMRAPRYYLNLASAGHFTYSDLCILDVAAIDEALDIDASNVLEDGCGPENLSPEVAFPVIRHYSIGLFNRWLRASTKSDALLDEASGQALGGADEVSFLAEP